MKTLTLSGWTQPTDALLPMLPEALTFDYSAYENDTDAIAALADYNDIPRIVAWSMGGQLVLKAIARGVLHPQELLLIAPPFQFVNDATFRDGMDPVTFAQFRDNYASHPERTASRFHGLVAKGDGDSRRVMSELSHHPHVTDTARWLPWLDGLGRDSLHGISMPHMPRVTIIHGAEDAIVPVAQATHIATLMPIARLEIWQDVAHAPHLHDGERVLSYLS